MLERRNIDAWLKWVALVGPIVTYLLGVASGAVGVFQMFRADSARITQLEVWKETQSQFNQETVKAVARLKALLKDVP